MGLGAKIKGALHGDHHDQSKASVKAPGAYPDEDFPQRHSKGRDYTAPHDESLVDETRNTNSLAGTHDLDSYSVGSIGATDSSWGLTNDPTQPSQGHRAQDSGVGLGTQASGKDRASEGAYWGDLSHEGRHGHGFTEDLPERTHRGQDHKGVSGGDHNPRFADQAVGGGVYDAAPGVGSPDHSDPYGRPQASGRAVHDPLTSGTQSTSIPTGNAYDQKTGHHNNAIPSFSDDHIGGGLTGAGAGAATGYGADEYARPSHDNAGFNSGYEAGGRNTHAPGVPHSSMLDPEPAGLSSATHQNRQVPGAAPTTQPGQGNPSTAASDTGLGKDHYGPAHEGAKVVHTCQHCGQDNDISRYFRKEAVYRLGS